MRQTEFGLDVASPLFTLLTLASSVSNERLIMCMYEMCGTFAVCKIASQVKLALEQAYGNRWGDARSGWENVNDVSGNPTDLWKRPPLIELSELTEFANKIQGLPRCQIVHTCREMHYGGCGIAARGPGSMLFGLSRLRGGEGLHLTNNVEIRMTRSGSPISGLDRRYADILLSNKDGSRECLVECQGKAIHGSIEPRSRTPIERRPCDDGISCRSNDLWSASRLRCLPRGDGTHHVLSRYAAEDKTPRQQSSNGSFVRRFLSIGRECSCAGRKRSRELEF